MGQRRLLLRCEHHVIAKEIFDDVRTMMVEILGVAENAVAPETALTNHLDWDLDFVELAARVEKSFGLKLPAREWSDFARTELGQLSIAELAPIFEKKYGITLSTAERRQCGKLGLEPMCNLLTERYRVAIPPAARIQWARNAMRRHARTFEMLFAQKLSAEDFARLVEAASTDVYSEKFANIVRGLFTVKMLWQFIAGSLARRAEGQESRRQMAAMTAKPRRQERRRAAANTGMPYAR